MQKLIQGIHHFQNTLFGKQRELFERLAKKQSPEALFITCSDSRINPNLLTQTDPGELFILRNAGNIIPAYGEVWGGEAATIEFAVSGLGIKDIIICGHSHCGAMNAVVDPTLREKFPALSRWLNHANINRTIIDNKYPELSGEALLMATIQENVLVQMEHLRSHPVVAAGIAKGKLKLHGWVYKIETGEVFNFSPKHDQFELLKLHRHDVIADKHFNNAEI
ncbi:carbonic anhydrase [Methylomonas sp. AM2-LC]|uniref:carbonic anhydrase n=1 Tax=Methylomonas sp. AM2-LC TaxID=3153301 RepID=UPI003267E8D9